MSHQTRNPDTRFSQSRKEWALGLDEQAEQYYAEYWDVADHQIGDLEGAFEGEYDASDEGRVAQWMDFTGIDKLVDCHDQIIPVAQRFRPDDRDQVDFSLRTSNGTGARPSEFTKITTGFAESGLFPEVYAFGVVDTETDEFRNFALISVSRLCSALELGEIGGEGPYPSSHGTEALYFPIDELRDAGCILAEWIDGYRIDGGDSE